MELATDRLRLRPLGHADAQGYGELLTDPDVHPFIVEDGPVPVDEVPLRIARKMLQWLTGSGATWAVLLDDGFAGYVSLHGLGSSSVAVSYAIAPALQNQGVGREALEAVLGTHDALRFARVEARTHRGNEASARMLSAAGFTEVAAEPDPPRRVFVWDVDDRYPGWVPGSSGER